MDTDNNNIGENLSSDNKSDSVYGGYRYRLSYDEYEGNFTRDKTRRSFKLTSILIGIAVFLIFLAVGGFILEYYSKNVSRFLQDSDNSSKSVANFQSYTEGFSD